MSENFERKKNLLKKDIGRECQHIKTKSKRYGYGNTVLVLLGIVISAAITGVSIFELGRIAAILGVILAALIAIQQAWPLGELGFFYRICAADLDTLDTSMLTVDNQVELEKTVEKFNVIKRYIAANPPRNDGLKAIQTMREELTQLNLG